MAGSRASAMWWLANWSCVLQEPISGRRLQAAVPPCAPRCLLPSNDRGRRRGSRLDNNRHAFVEHRQRGYQHVRASTCTLGLRRPRGGSFAGANRQRTFLGRRAMAWSGGPHRPPQRADRKFHLVVVAFGILMRALRVGKAYRPGAIFRALRVPAMPEGLLANRLMRTVGGGGNGVRPLAWSLAMP